METQKSRIIVAVAEGRRQTCGLVEMDIAYPLNINLCATSESSATWHDTINTIARMSPDVLLVSLSQRDSPLTVQLKETLNCTIRCIGRKSFNQSNGESEYGRLSANKITSSPTYLECAALNVLLEHVIDEEDCTFANGCISFVEVSPSGRLLMDQATLENLEIVRNRRTGHRQGSLFGLFKPSSGSGARLLKKTLMSPICDVNTLNGRYDVVDLLNEKNGVLRKIQQKLRQTNLEQICRLLVFVPRKQSNLNCARSIAGVLGLVDLLRTLPGLGKIIQELQSSASTEMSSNLLQCMADNLLADVFPTMLATIRNLLALNSLDEDSMQDDDGSSSSSSNGGGSSQKSSAYNIKQRRQIFCVKPGVSGSLDVSRATYLLCLESIDQLFNSYVASWDVVGLELRHEKNAIVLRMPIGSEHLPNELDIQRRTKKYMCGSTKELGSLVKRVQECIHECYHHTFAAIQNLLLNIRLQIQAISSIADSLAYLDLLTTFSTLSSNHNYTRPDLLHQQGARVGTIAISQGRHPIAERLHQGTRFIPNDVLLTAGRNVQLVLGPNSSGKSTYLRTVAVTVVLAQSGCFVPAKRCQLQLRDRILSRLSCEDDCEKNLSTFELEASEAAYICRSLTSCSLILFDEFGRSTSSKEALSLSYAVAGNERCVLSSLLCAVCALCIVHCFCCVVKKVAEFCVHVFFETLIV